MNPLTQKFLRYRAKPKPVEFIGPRQPELYPIEGFVSPTETVLERMGRLVEAQVKGLRLSPANILFFKSHRRIVLECASGARFALKATQGNRFAMQGAERELEYLARHTAPIYRG